VTGVAGGGGCGLSGVCGSTRWTAPGPVVLPRARCVNWRFIWFWLRFRDGDGLPIAVKIGPRALR